MDGLTILSNVLRNDEINYLSELCKNKKYKEMKQLLLNNGKLKTECLQKTTPDYVFQDYIWIIQKSAVHTCHRDNNGDFFNKGQTHPSYTVIVYLEPMEKCMGVIPKSHLKKDAFNYNITDQVVNLVCNPGDIILFNANLIHVGAMNKGNDHLRCQLKFSHKDDIEVLGYYEKYNKV
jgi:ectoine hydroxylase-related dioxygenase (phytanoyl-CoA dioxygenase family)